MEFKPNYGNWVSMRVIFVPAALGLIFLGLTLLSPVLVFPAGLFLFISLYFLYARCLFSPRGELQDQIRDQVLAHLDWDGEGQALDIGCGNGALTIDIAHDYPRTRVLGIDCWGKKWEYSKDTCERNARIEGVNDRVSFEKANASALPFNDECFDAVVSNLVFHEVHGTADKRELIYEALRVVRKGGKFSFQDPFLLKQAYGDIDDLIENIRSRGINKVEFIETRNMAFIPWTLKLPFMVGRIGIIAGEK